MLVHSSNEVSCVLLSISTNSEVINLATNKDELAIDCTMIQVGFMHSGFEVKLVGEDLHDHVFP